MSDARDAFRIQADTCAGMGSPFTARLCALLADRLAPGDPVSDRLLGWPGNATGRGDAVPLRLAGALHALVLDRRNAALVAAWPPNAPDDAALWDAVMAAFATETAFLMTRLDGPPQTNEPMRSAALAPGYLTVAALTGLPLTLSEIGTSAGLNLLWDRFAYAFGPDVWGDPGSPVRLVPDWRGPPPPLPPARVAARAGCDLAPLDATDPAAQARLLSFVWADQTARLDRLRAAFALAAADPPPVVRADAADWLETRLRDPSPGTAHVVAHSIVWQYLPAATRTRIEACLAAAGSRATPDAPLAWLRLEPDTSGAPGAALTLTLWPDGTTRCLARADFHGAWVHWSGA